MSGGFIRPPKPLVVSANACFSLESEGRNVLTDVSTMPPARFFRMPEIAASACGKYGFTSQQTKNYRSGNVGALEFVKVS